MYCEFVPCRHLRLVASHRLACNPKHVRYRSITGNLLVMTIYRWLFDHRKGIIALIALRILLWYTVVCTTCAQ